MKDNVLDIQKDVFNQKNNIIHYKIKSFNKNAIHSGISIKACISGLEVYKVDQKQFTLKANDILIVNHGTKVEVDIESQDITEGVCIYLDESLVKKAYNEMFLCHESQLDMKHCSTFEELPLNKYLDYFKLSPYQHAIQTAVSNNVVNEEFYYNLAYQIALDQSEFNNKFQNLKHKKNTTKIELNYRLQKALQYIHQNYKNNIQIKDIAQSSFLSEFYFLRNFKTLYQKTPHQYIEMLRSQEAAKMIMDSSMSFYEISKELGFSELSSFSRSFKKHFNLSPTQYLRQKKQ